jgi:glyoxylase-like metal-dependent hydrolase (beta-lactamase superfamily II)
MDILCVPVGPLQANCYLVSDDAGVACAVDPGGEPERLARLLEKKGLRLEAVLVTHGHFDHVEGVKGLAEATGAKVYCSGQVQPVLSGNQGCSATGYPVPAVGAPAIQVVSDGEKLSVGDLTVTVIATPGHTPGDVTFNIGGALFCGDLLFRRSVGRTDFPGGNFPQLLASVARLVRSYPAETEVFPGHMESTTLGEELAHNPFLASLKANG